MKILSWIALGLLALLAILFLPFRSEAQVPSITIEWTAPGDDGTVSRASTYDIRYRNTNVAGTDTLTWWNGATVVAGPPVPSISGTREVFTITPSGGFAVGTWYVAMKACDAAGNCSGYSNIATKTISDIIPPSRIIDLIVR